MPQYFRDREPATARRAFKRQLPFFRHQPDRPDRSANRDRTIDAEHRQQFFDHLHRIGEAGIVRSTAAPDCPIGVKQMDDQAVLRRLPPQRRPPQGRQRGFQQRFAEQLAHHFGQVLPDRYRADLPVNSEQLMGQINHIPLAYRAAQAAIQMLHDAGRLRPEPMPWSEFVLGVECGGSDGSSGIVSNPVTGRLADRVIDAGGTVIMSETLELLGGEEMLGRRAVTPEVAAKVKGIIQRTLDYAAEHNLDIMGANPAPDNIAGGLTTIEEKALGAIKKGGTRPLVEVLEEGERPTKKGFVIMDAPAPGVENLTAIVSGGCHAVIFSTGKGNCIGHPVAPVIKISGNPMTVKAMRDNIDVDVSGVINQGLTLDQATDIVQDKLVDVCWGAMTSSDMLGEIETAASRLLRTL